MIAINTCATNLLDVECQDFPSLKTPAYFYCLFRRCKHTGIQLYSTMFLNNILQTYMGARLLSCAVVAHRFGTRCVHQPPAALTTGCLKSLRPMVNYQTVMMDIYGYLWIFMDIYGSHRFFFACYDRLWPRMADILQEWNHQPFGSGAYQPTTPNLLGRESTLLSRLCASDFPENRGCNQCRIHIISMTPMTLWLCNHVQYVQWKFADVGYTPNW